MHFTRDQYRQIIIHPDGGVTIDLIADYHVQSQAVSNTEQDAHGLECIWTDEELTFESFIKTLRDQGRVSGMEWKGTGTQLRALMDFLTDNEFIQKVSRPRFIELAKNTFQINKLKDRSSLNTISWKQYDREMVFLQKSFFGG